MSPESGILDADLVHRIFEKAGHFTRDALLIKVIPELVTAHTMLSGEILHTVQNWRFEFFSESKHCVFYINPADPGWVDQGSMRSPQEKPKSWLSEAMLSSCKVDGNMAYIIAYQTGCKPMGEGKGSLVLEAIIIDGAWRPVWRMPLEFDGNSAGVLADTCEVIASSRQSWRKPSGVIWNA